MGKTNTLFVLYRCFVIVLRNLFAKQVYDIKKRVDVHAACKNVCYNPQRVNTLNYQLLAVVLLGD